MNHSGRRRGTDFHPRSEMLEGRLLLTTMLASSPLAFLKNPPGFQVVRPNTPVLPYASPSKTATFIDTTTHVSNGAHVVVGQKTLVRPYVTLNATSGFIKIGSNSDIQDNSMITSNPNRIPHSENNVLIGDSVVIAYGATILGPSTIGAYGAAAKPTMIGPNAEIDGATIEPGAFVGALARVGPGVTVPGGFAVLPGSNVTTNEQASNPALGMVVPVTAAQTNAIKTDLTNSASLAAGYTTLYQGNSATGASPGTTTSGIFNGNLSTVEGASAEPGSTTVSFEPSSNLSPRFPVPSGALVGATLFNFRARVIGGAVFHARAMQIQNHLGRSNSIGADQGQPITISSVAGTGRGVTVNSPVGGKVTIGQNFQAGSGAVILSGPTVPTTLGDNVSIGAGAVVTASAISSGATVGDRAYVSGSTVPAGATVPAGEILINNKVVGFVQW